MIDGILIIPLKIIEVAEGNVMHAMKSVDVGYKGFGEAYFSDIEQGVVKAWKRHRAVTLNIVVPVGKIRFVLFDDRSGSPSDGLFQEVFLSRHQYNRLTVPPMVWMGFQGLAKGSNMLLSLSNLPHDFDEADRKKIGELKFDWRINE